MCFKNRKLFALMMLIALPILFLSCANHCELEASNTQEVQVEHSNLTQICCFPIVNEELSIEISLSPLRLLANYKGSGGFEIPLSLFKPPKIST